MEHAERGRELALRIRDHRERQVAQRGLVGPPREVNVVRVRADTEHLGPAGPELGRPPPELRDLGRTDEREIHRPEEDDLPLAWVRLLVDLLELAAWLRAHDGLEPEGRKGLANAAHAADLLCVTGRPDCRP